MLDFKKVEEGSEKIVNAIDEALPYLIIAIASILAVVLIFWGVTDSVNQISGWTQEGYFIWERVDVE